MKPLGLVNGKLVDLDENVIPIEDRGHLFGDGAYEVTEVHNGKIFTLREHMERLFRSLNEIRIPIPYNFHELASFHELLVKETGIKEGGIYLQVTRGVAPRVHNFPDNIVPRLSMTLRPPMYPPTTLWENGAKCISVPDERWFRCDIKSLNLLSSVLCKQKAKEAGCFEVVMVRDGWVTECAHSNFFVIKEGKLWTHPINNMILKGITRTIVVEKVATKLGIQVQEAPFNMEFVRKADEAFLTATTLSVVPVVSIDGIPVGNGQRGEITNKIQAEFLVFRENECS